MSFISLVAAVTIKVIIILGTLCMYLPDNFNKVWPGWSASLDQGINIEQKIHEYELLHFGNFTFQSGQTANNYFDMRAINSHPDLLGAAVDKWIHELDSGTFDIVCGVATGGLAPASVLAYRLDKPYIYIRGGKELGEGKDHGLGNVVEGHWSEGDRVLLVDDVLTTGGSLLRSANYLENVLGLKVISLAILLDRRPDPPQSFDRWPLISVTTKDKVFESSA